MLVVGLELFLIQSDYCCCVFLVEMPETCVAGSWRVDVHVPQESKTYVSMLPTTTKEDSDGVSLQTATPAAIGRKDLVSTSMTRMFCMLWIGGEVAQQQQEQEQLEQKEQEEQQQQEEEQ